MTTATFALWTIWNGSDRGKSMWPTTTCLAVTLGTGLGDGYFGGIRSTSAAHPPRGSLLGATPDLPSDADAHAAGHTRRSRLRSHLRASLSRPLGLTRVASPRLPWLNERFEESVHPGVAVGHRRHRLGRVEANAGGEDLGNGVPEAGARRSNRTGFVGYPPSVGPPPDLVPGDPHERPRRGIHAPNLLVACQPPPPMPRRGGVLGDDPDRHGPAMMVVKADPHHGVAA